jgi:hypothetical protein
VGNIVDSCIGEEACYDVATTEQSETLQTLVLATVHAVRLVPMEVQPETLWTLALVKKHAMMLATTEQSERL